MSNDIWKKYQRIGILGFGALGKVYTAKYNNEFFAVKEIKKTTSDANFSKAIRTMKKMDCENSAKVIEGLITKDAFYIVSELCDSNLGDYLKKRYKGFSIEEIRELLIDLNKGLKVMAEKKIIHGNIKPSNILLSFNINNVNKVCFKISDFGLSKLFEENIISKSKRDTSEFISPELMKGEEINDKSDIWSLGILIYYLLFQNYPYNGTQYEIMKQIESNKQLNVVNDELLDDLLKRMLNPNVNERINWEGYFKLIIYLLLI